MGCLMDLFQNATHIECLFEVTADIGGPRTCPGLDAVGGTLGPGGACAGAEISLLRDGVDGFAAAVTDTSGGADVTLTPLITGSCDLGLAAPDVQFSAAAPPTPILTLVKIDVAPNGPESRFVILPLKVAFIDGTCDLDGAETRCQVVRAVGERVEKCFLE
jgi:hypothetical protein